MEYFKDVPGYEGLYQVSNHGRVLSHVRISKFLKPHLHKWGYLTVCLIDGRGGRKYCKIHRLVLAAFRGPSDKMVNHINHIRHDNHLSNLEYCTALENVQHCVRAGRNSKPPRTVGKVPTHVIRAIRKSTESYSVLSRKYNMSISHAHRIRTRAMYVDIQDE